MNGVMKENKKMNLDINEVEDKEKIHKMAETFREIADLYDELIEKGKTEEEMENILAKIYIKYSKISKL